jgi:hypothetical protein
MPGREKEKTSTPRGEREGYSIEGRDKQFQQKGEKGNDGQGERKRMSAHP